ncbi:MAG: DUF4834 domain-containing protein [Cytophagales bacterium]|nr:DUF4834 domain-containing protein [Cytophagales bacterium]
MVLKFILISLLVIFVLSRVGGFLFRTLFWVLGARVVEKQMRQQQRPRRAEGDVRVENNATQSRQSPKKGGDYIDIDYEEVK